jgi:uncharacterized repeat protein (TIGR01451 family)
VEVKAVRAGDFRSSVSAGSDTRDPKPHDNTSEIEGTIRAANANLFIDRFDIERQGSEIGAGDVVEFSIVVRNRGPDTAENVRISLDAGKVFEVVKVVPTLDRRDDPKKCTVLRHTVTCTRKQLRPQNDSIVLRVEVEAVAAGEFASTITAGSETPDPDPKDNASEIEGTIQPGKADLQVTVARQGGAPTPAALAVGDRATYRVLVTNNGPAKARDITFGLKAGAGLVVKSFTSAHDCEQTPQQVVCRNQVLSPRGGFVLRVEVEATRTGTSVLAAMAESETADPKPANNKASLRVTVEPKASEGGPATNASAGPGGEARAGPRPLPKGVAP